MIYLDNAATTFPKPNSVYQAVDSCQRNYAVNVGRGSYSIANSAMRIVDETRELMAKLVGAASPDRVIFTPSATIAANEIIFGLEWTPYKTVYVTPFEHNAVARPLNRILCENHISARMIPFDSSTQELRLDDMERMFATSPPDYVFINHVSNVTGVILPLRQICKKAKEYGAIVIVDGSQSVGLIDISIIDDGVDFLIFAGHKNLYASLGIGGFIMGDYRLAPVISGGTGSDSLNLEMPAAPPSAFEAGSPNIVAISSLNASLKWIEEIGPNTIKLHKNELMRHLVAGIQGSSIISYLPANRINHTSVLSINIPGYQASEVGLILNEDYDIAVRTGYHCAPYIHRFLNTEQHLGTVRISLGYFNTSEEIDATISALKEIERGN
jgi:cysteine desulfurase family protein